MRKPRHRLARILAALTIGVALLTALSLVVNHVELSLSLPGEPPSAGEGSVESTHFQTGFRNSQMYGELVQWKRAAKVGALLNATPPPSRWDRFVRFTTHDYGYSVKSELTLNGWLLATTLGVYPLCVWIIRLVRRLRATGAPACQKCGYDLTGNVSGVCPECGHEINSSIRPVGATIASDHSG